MTARIVSTARMSNTGYHANGKPNWWARVGTGDTARFLAIPHVRGDAYLDVVVEGVEPGTVVRIGAGRGSRKTVRETVTALPVAPEPAPAAEVPAAEVQPEPAAPPAEAPDELSRHPETAQLADQLRRVIAARCDRLVGEQRRHYDPRRAVVVGRLLNDCRAVYAIALRAGAE